MLCLPILTLKAGAQEEAESIALEELAAQADAVALVRVSSTDYVYRREFPYRGSALLDVLIAYKGEKLPQVIEVYEEGLRPFECYFPDPPVTPEGRRYLVFLAQDPEKPQRFRGLPQGCALDVLVTSENRYAVRLPLDGVKLSDDLRPLAEPMDFADRHAIVEEDSLKPARRDALLLAGDLAPVERSPRDPWTEAYRYTRGIPLERFRPLLGLEIK